MRTGPSQIITLSLSLLLASIYNLPPILLAFNHYEHFVQLGIQPDWSLIRKLAHLTLHITHACTTETGGDID